MNAPSNEDLVEESLDDWDDSDDHQSKPVTSATQNAAASAELAKFQIKCYFFASQNPPENIEVTSDMTWDTILDRICLQGNFARRSGSFEYTDDKGSRRECCDSASWTSFLQVLKKVDTLTIHAKGESLDDMATSTTQLLDPPNKEPPAKRSSELVFDLYEGQQPLDGNPLRLPKECTWQVLSSLISRVS